jgi:hypothetical protein
MTHAHKRPTAMPMGRKKTQPAIASDSASRRTPSDPLLDREKRLGTIKSVPSAKRTVSSFFLVEERRNQKEAPSYAPSAHPCATGSRVTTGFFDGASLHRRKTARIVRTALRVNPPPPAAPQGPRRAAGSCPQSQEESCAACAILSSQAMARRHLLQL